MSELRVVIVEIENAETEFVYAVPQNSIVFNKGTKEFYVVNTAIMNNETLANAIANNKVTLTSNTFTDELKENLEKISFDLSKLGDLSLFNNWTDEQKQTFVTTAVSTITQNKVCIAMFAGCQVIVSQIDGDTNLYFIAGGNLYKIDKTAYTLSYIQIYTQADWNENDVTKLSYINNRICYVDEDGVVHKIDNQFLNVAQVAIDGEYESLLNKPTIPTKVSELDNDSDFATNDEVDTKIREQEATYISADASMVIPFEHCTYIGDTSSNLENGAWYKDGIECSATNNKFVTKNDYAIVSNDESVCYSVIHGFRYQRKKDGGATPFGYVELPDSTHTHAIIQQVTDGTYKGALYFTDNSKVFSTNDLVFCITSLSVLTNAVIEFENEIGGTILGQYDLYFPTTRYICSKSQTATENPIWSFAYFVNDTPMTGEQLNSLNSGANSTNIAQITTNKNDIADLNTALSNKVDKETNKGLSTNDFTNNYKAKLNAIVDGACRVTIGGFSKSTGFLMGTINVWNTPHDSGYGSPDQLIQVYAIDIKVSDGVIISANTDGVIDISSALSGIIAGAVGTAKGEILGSLSPQISNKLDIAPTKNETTTLSASKRNDFGTLTENLSLSLPTIEDDTYPIFDGEFTTDSAGSYGVTFPVTMKGDTDLEANSKYWFTICNGNGIIVKVSE